MPLTAEDVRVAAARALDATIVEARQSPTPPPMAESDDPTPLRGSGALCYLYYLPTAALKGRRCRWCEKDEECLNPIHSRPQMRRTLSLSREI